VGGREEERKRGGEGGRKGGREKEREEERERMKGAHQNLRQRHGFR